MAADDVDGLLELAEWARERKLRSKEEIVYKKVLEIDPDDPIARRELGYAVFKNRWVKESELKAKRGLVQFRGDWVTPEEKDRRLTEELKKEISDLFRDVDSDNQYIREYSVKKLMEYREPRVGKVALGFLTDPREAVRAVALQLLASIAAGGEAGKSAGKGPGGSKPAAGKAGGKTAGKSAPSSGPSEDEVCAAILDRALNEESRVVRTSLVNVLQKIHSRRLFDLALGVVETSANALHRDRAAEVVLYTLHKAWMDDLIAALGRRPKWSPTTGGNPQVRSILAKISREDFEYRVADWKGWWERNRHRFMDEE